MVLFIAWLTLLPAIGPLPHTSHRLAITEGVYHEPDRGARRAVAGATLGVTESAPARARANGSSAKSADLLARGAVPSAR